MSTLTVARYGFVWCTGCGKTEQRGSEVEPLPFCQRCNEWMEVLLCDEIGCEVEAVAETDRGCFCSDHVK